MKLKFFQIKKLKSSPLEKTEPPPPPNFRFLLKIPISSDAMMMLLLELFKMTYVILMQDKINFIIFFLFQLFLRSWRSLRARGSRMGREEEARQAWPRQDRGLRWRRPWESSSRNSRKRFYSSKSMSWKGSSRGETPPPSPCFFKTWIEWDFFERNSF